MQYPAGQPTLSLPEPGCVDGAAASSTCFASFVAGSQNHVCRSDSYASPGLAEAWAKAIVTSWRAAYAAGQLDPAQPLYLLDLAPGGGHLARLLWHALHRHLAEVEILSSFRKQGQAEERFGASDHRSASSLGWSIRYLACAAPGGTDFQLGEGSFDTLTWSPLDHGAPPPSYRYAFRWHESRNPVVVLALDYLQAFPGQLRAVHYGEWLEGRVRVAAKHGNGCELEYDWRVIAGNDPCCSVALQECYLRTLSNSSVLIPDAGLRTVQRLAELSHGRFLWLAAGQGVIDERQLRFGAMSPPTSWSYQAPAAPVNFHALAYEQSRYGAWCWHGQQHEEGTVVQAIWRHDGVPMAQNVALKLSEHLRHFQPDDAVQLETLAAALPPESPPSVHLALLRSAHHDPRVLRTTLAHWVENPPELTDAERSYWGEAIAYAWEGCPRIGDEADLRHNMAVFAVQLGRLDIARIMFEHDSNRMGLAMCYSLGGRIDLALSCLEGIDDSYVDMLRSDLRRRMERWRMLGWYHAEASHDGELCLVPLDEDHALALYEQYRDPQIGDLTRLPDLDTPEAASEWIAEQSQETKRSTYALMHAGLGLIGIVSMHAHGEDAYFFFWIGSAHQGRGYGRRAARLLFRQAEYEGVRRLFTSAYRSNRRSTQALMAVQFRQLSIGALPPDDDLIFFVRDNEGRPRNEAALHARLAALLQANDSPIELASEFCAGEETMRDKSEVPGKNVLLPA